MTRFDSNGPSTPDFIERSGADDRGVSPVIGVVLMVAVTVILASVIGSLVLDFGQAAGQRAPSASLSVTADAGTNNVTIAHVGGGGLADDRTRIVVTNETGGGKVTFEPGTTDEVFSVGDEVVVNTTAPGGAATIGSSGDVFAHRDAAGSAFIDGGIKRGMRYSVQVIDTDTQRVIYETTLTA